MTAALLAAGVRYQDEYGWYVFAVGGPDKKPLANCHTDECLQHFEPEDMLSCPCLACHGAYAATRDEHRLAAQLGLAGPNAHLALATGRRSGIVVIDLDPRPGHPLSAVLDSVRRAFQGRSSLVIATTPGGGAHYLFQAPADEPIPNSVGRVAPCVDVRSDGGYVLLPPASGRCWHPKWGPPPIGEPFPTLTPLLIELARYGPLGPPTVSRTLHRTTAKGNPRSLAHYVAESADGERNSILHWAGCRGGELVARGAAMPDALEDLLVRAAQSAGLNEREARRTVRNSMRRGEREAGR